MRYIIRALKYMVYFAVMFVIIVSIVYLFSSQKLAGVPLSDLFKEGSLLKILLLFMAFSLVYPALSFQKKELPVGEDFTKHAEEVESVMESLGYVKESSSSGKVVYRCRSAYARFSRMYEDRITFDTGSVPVTVEGYRKDLMRIVSGVTYRIRNASEDNL